MAALNFRAPVPALAPEAVPRRAKSETCKIAERRAINPSPKINRFRMDQTGESAKVRIALVAGPPGVRRHYTDHCAKRAEIGRKLKNCALSDTSGASRVSATRSTITSAWEPMRPLDQRCGGIAP